MYDPVSHLVYTTRGDDVDTTIVNGRVLMRDGKVLTLDEAAGARRGAHGGRAGARRAVRPCSDVRRYLSSTPMYGRLRYCSA